MASLFPYPQNCTETFDDGETDIAFGFGFPESNVTDAEGETVNLSKAEIACENFILRYFDTEDIEVAKAWVNAEIAKIEAGDYSNPVVPTGGTTEEPVPMSVANGSFNITLGTFVTNSGWKPTRASTISQLPPLRVTTSTTTSRVSKSLSPLGPVSISTMAKSTSFANRS